MYQNRLRQCLFGTTTQKACSYPFGELTYEWANATNDLRFPGQIHDRETDLHYNWRRYYDPKTGRYMEADPLVKATGTGNPYSYALNSPSRFTDPSGLWVPTWDDLNNTVTVVAENGDKLSGLYSQLGLTSSEFGEHFGISNVGSFVPKPGETAFDVTEFTLNNADIDGSFTGSNCHGFVSYAGGKGDAETILPQVSLADRLSTAAPGMGDWAIFYMIGQFQYVGQPEPVNAAGIQGYSAIYLLKNQADEAQYLNRIDTGQPVSISSQSEIVAFLADPENAYGGPNNYLILPKLDPPPQFYKCFNR